MSVTRKDSTRQRAIEHLDIIKRFTLEISSINSHLERVRQLWGKALGVSGPQWMILMAISDLDKDVGVPINVVSKLLHVDPSFVTTQSKLLEQKELLRRAPSPADARVVRLSLTDKTRKHLAGLAEQHKAFKKTVVRGIQRARIGRVHGQACDAHQSPGKGVPDRSDGFRDLRRRATLGRRQRRFENSNALKNGRSERI